MYIKSTAILWSVLLVVGVGFGQEAEEEPKPIELIHADVLRNRTLHGQAIQELIGEVHIIQDGLNVTCDKAIHFQEEGRLIFEGNVVFWDSIRTLNAKQVVYYQRTRRATATGEVVIIQDTLEIQCQKALYLDNLGDAYFDGGVSVLDQASGSTITGGRGTYSDSMGMAKVVDDPVFTERDTTDSVMMEIFGERIEYFTEKHLAVARDSVLVLRGDLNATGDLLEYDRDEGWAVLSGSPRIYRANESVRGDTVWLYFREGDIERVFVNRNAYASIPADTLGTERMNWMCGKTIDMTIENGELSKTVVTGQAEALYYPVEEGERRGANRVSGDTITLWINGGEVTRIQVQGGTQGTYYPERMVHRADY
jgi:lipopolysaccharide export system protein LptA